MKKKILLISFFAIIISYAILLCPCLSFAAGEGYSQTNEPSYWKKLSKAAPYELTFTPRIEDSTENANKKDFKKLFISMTTKSLLLELKPISKALEKSQISEPVLLELVAQQDDYILSQIGKVTPTLQEDKIIINLPSVIPINISKKYLDNILLKILKTDLPLNHPEECFLIFKDLYGKIKVKAKATCTFPFDYEHKVYEQLARFLAKDEINQAEQFCSQLKEKQIIKNQCYRTLGNAFFENNNYPKAEIWFDKSQYREGFDKIALNYYDSGEILNSLHYFDKGIMSITRAYAYAKAGDIYLNNENNSQLAESYYKKATIEFENLIKSYRYSWNKKDSDERLRLIKALNSFPKSQNDIAQQEILSRLLAKSASYCDRLYNNFFHFFCEEVITEYTNLSWDMVGTFTSDAIPVTKNKYIYEYQLIKEEDGKIAEQRTLLKQNGAKKNLPNAPLMTRNHYQKLIFGPIAFLSKKWQDSFDYKILREDTYKGDKVVVIEAIPKEFRNYNALVGNIWIKEDKNGDVDILKLEWNAKTILDNFKELLTLQKRFRADLAIDFYAEFDIKRKGFRLPSKYYIEESYLKNDNEEAKKFIRLKTEVVFREHRYFSTSSEVISTDRNM